MLRVVVLFAVVVVLLASSSSSMLTNADANGNAIGVPAGAAPEGEAEAPVMLALMPPPEDYVMSGAGHMTSLPLSVYVRVSDDVCEALLARGAELPARRQMLFTTTQDNQGVAHVELYAGERPFCAGNLFLGTLELAPLPTPSYRSFVQLEVSVEVDAAGVITCQAAELESRAMGEPFCKAEWQGDLLGAGGPPPEGKREGREIAVFSHALAKHLPVLLATRSVRLPGGRDIVIRQHQRREEEKIGTGGVLWEAAIVLADYVGRNQETFAWQGKRVLELGAGTGLVAIALALEGAEVCATDGNPGVLVGAEKNVKSAAPLVGTVRVDTFDWNSPEDLARILSMGPWDAVVGSDLVYPGNAGRKCVLSNDTKPPADETLLALLTQLISPTTLVVLALKDRTGEVERFVSLASEPARGWHVERAAPEAIMPEFRDQPSVVVLHLRRTR